ncbi:sialidase family protein [Roseimicrobium sp. ORNL1]|uniref:sialidase family protein n=1 Tax=Roseimicrobium sp. ORNL1 TaxID=2711231 RepID=UPI0013E1C047|nr:sialidase family protein [Roseimicrobium sp. ORNL1]QIF03665.1 exo-alpha-sialidase [Roseimicrobium sp. ORNL1]
MQRTTSSSTNISRRSLLRTGTAAAAASFFVTSKSGAAAPAVQVLDTKVISQQPEYYCGWPTVARRANGELWLAWSGGREEHVCPFGQVVAMTSKDNGATWNYPRVLLDSAIDDRDAGVLETAKGTLLVTTFTSLAYEPTLEKAEKEGKWPADRLKRWQAARDWLTPEQRKAELGVWLVRSTDGGLTWSSRLPTLVNSPHGPIQLKDGRLLYAGKQLWTEEKKIGVCESKDDGLTWQWLADLPTREGDTARNNYHELHAVEAKDGTIIVQIRNHNKADAGGTLQTESKDGGKTWSAPHAITFGLPTHLLRLKDDRLLMTYGHRKPPFGNQARISEDNGKTWSEPMIISGDGAGGDLGYPSTVELDNGTLLTVWYEKMKDVKRAVLRQAVWKLA